jgi:hypothetical protein
MLARSAIPVSQSPENGSRLCKPGGCLRYGEWLLLRRNPLRTGLGSASSVSGSWSNESTTILSRNPLRTGLGSARPEASVAVGDSWACVAIP